MNKLIVDTKGVPIELIKNQVAKQMTINSLEWVTNHFSEYKYTIIIMYDEQLYPDVKIVRNMFRKCFSDAKG